MFKTSRIFVAGGDTLLGSAILRELRACGYHPLQDSYPEPDYRRDGAVAEYFVKTQPEYVFVAAGDSGGIQENQERPADLMVDNLSAVSHLIPLAYRHQVRKVLYLSSACVYPRSCPQPMREEFLLTGPMEPTSDAYAMARLTGIYLCRAYRQQYGVPFVAAIPTNYFGPGDRFDGRRSHVVAGLIQRLVDAQRNGANHLDIWGSGTPRRELLPVGDVARAAIYAMEHYDSDEPINLAGGPVLSIAELAKVLQEIVGYGGELRFDTSKPDGAPEKSLDGSKLAGLGWRPEEDLVEALGQTHAWYVSQGPGKQVA